MNLKVNDTVQLLVDLPEHLLSKGAVGVVVMEYDDPTEAYEVEFCDEHGDTTAQVALLPTQIALQS
ncbi:DUF4926 domain-containing protein [Cupriavidus sp. 30B13]|uniref:DUF4926 domain-containing protein n=1 Tax=Cupriavidus sp. 30B13 TaxID=3384241 RepID=UPI003B9067C6